MAATPVHAGTLVHGATIEHDGLSRYFDYYVPDGLSGTAVPLLFVLHGGTVNNSSVSSWYHALADQEPFIVIYPNGTSARTGQSGATGSFNWNDCRIDAGDSTTTADDVGFISALIDWAQATFAIDAERVYATGLSNGGIMSYRLAFELSDRIAAVAAIIASLPGESECPPAPARGVSVLIMNGTADPIMPWDGGQVAGGRGEVVSATATRDFWRTFLGTDPIPQHVEFPDSNTTDASTVGLDIYSNGRKGSTLYFYGVNGGGHQVPSIATYVGAPIERALGKQNRDIEATDEVWRFLAPRRLHATPAAETASGGGGDEGCALRDRHGSVGWAVFVLGIALLLCRRSASR